MQRSAVASGIYIAHEMRSCKCNAHIFVDIVPFILRAQERISCATPKPGL